MAYTITLPIIPTAQMRDRIGTIHGHARSYKHPGQKKEERYLSGLLLEHVPALPFDCAIVIKIRAYLPMPSTKPQWWKDAAKLGIIMPTGKPDWDNLGKQICDVMTKMQFWQDDKLIVKGTVEKWYSEHPRWEIEYTALKQPGSKKEWEEMINKPPQIVLHNSQI